MKRIIDKYNQLLDARQKNRIFILFFLMLIGAFLEVIGVSLMLPLVSAIMIPDIIESNKYVAWVCRLFGLHSYRTFVIVCIIALIVVYIVKDLFVILEYYAQYRFVYNNQFATQMKLLHVYMKRPYEYYLNAESGEILRVVNADVSNTYTLLTTLLSLVTESIVSFALLITVFIISPRMTIFVAVMMGISMLVIAKIVKPVLRKEGLRFQQNSAKSYKWLMQAIGGIKEVKVAQKESFFEDQYEQSGTRLVKAQRTNSIWQNIPRLLIEMTSVCSMLAIIAVLIYMGEDVESLVPALSAFAMAAVKLLPSANRIVGAVNSVAYLEPSLDKLLENISILDEHESDGTVAEIETCAKNSSVKKMQLNDNIEMRGISYHYPNTEKNVLQAANMKIPVGSSVGIVGSSGAGKTTAVDILLGLLRPQKGQIFADGVDVSENYHEWLAQIGYIPQVIFMLDDTIRSNIAFGVHADRQSDELVWKALEEAQLADFVRSLPDGLETRIGERGIRLSGGQRQRIGIARALYGNPQLLIFDEATSALDNETETAIMESINALHGKKTMIIIAHRLTTIEECDMVYRVEDGKILQER